MFALEQENETFPLFTNKLSKLTYCLAMIVLIQ